ncbi:MAG: class I SAM-dependent methyltransferase [Planctomycetes bacterium]|nr:class I SAM-dependent methyltransferase [Planctomycetota bacterium]
MPSDSSFLCDAFPRSNRYHPDWIRASLGGGAHPLWLTEWLTQALDLRPGMKVLDLGCGRAASSVFLHQEFGVHVWAVDLWYSATENARRVADAGASQGVFPLRANARALPFPDEYFDAIVSVDSFMYYGTDDTYLAELARFLKPGGVIGIAQAGLIHEIEGDLPEHLRTWWEPGCWSLHAADWWRRHWDRLGIVQIQCADTMPEGWRRWLDWHLAVCPENRVEIEALQADAGRTLGYVRVVAQRREEVRLDPPITTIPTEYTATPFWREARG